MGRLRRWLHLDDSSASRDSTRWCGGTRSIQILRCASMSSSCGRRSRLLIRGWRLRIGRWLDSAQSRVRSPEWRAKINNQWRVARLAKAAPNCWAYREQRQPKVGRWLLRFHTVETPTSRIDGEKWGTLSWIFFKSFDKSCRLMFWVASCDPADQSMDGVEA